MSVNGYALGGFDSLLTKDYVLKTLVRNAMIQHADCMAILHGYLYFNTD